ncbi:MAG: hypothetical protein LBI58_04250 [Tannerellaceae bacterium]|jgi:hypothetical protein|nr:hypothetical protein [Tannerellaceae bacterium]
MIDLQLIKKFFPASVRSNSANDKHLLKEYLQLTILDHLSSMPGTGKMVFIGGTNGHDHRPRSLLLKYNL